MKKPQRKTLLLALFVLIPLLLMCFGTFVAIVTKISHKSTAGSYGTLSSCSALADRLSTDSYPIYYEGASPTKGVVDDVSADGAAEQGTGSFSQTNVQVAGVDESDVIKTDGEYIYVIKGGEVFIIDAADPSLTDYVSTLTFADPAVGLFIDGNNLVVFTSGYHYYEFPSAMDMTRPAYWQGSRDKVSMLVYDTANIEEPELKSTTSFDGALETARLKDGIVYVVANYYPYYYGEVSAAEAEALLPQIAYAKPTESDVEYVPMAGCTDVAYYGDAGTRFTEVVTLDLNETNLDNALFAPKVLVGNTETVYMSLNNLYLTTSKYGDESEPLPCDAWQEALSLCTSDVIPTKVQEYETEIFRLAINDGGLEFAASGIVPGNILNQFSLDEHSGYFRVATTRTELYGSATINNLYVLDDSLAIVGSLEGLAEGETIYSARFIGDRAYMVTFEQTDPLFVIDLSVPTSPKLLGELQLPGFSEYLHPYDDTHIIGFGKDASNSGVVSGLKVALFDVTDPANPIEISKLELGERGSDSELLNDHKALLFDREKGLLVFPMSLYGAAAAGDWYGSVDFVGFGVFSIDLTKGIVERGRLANHSEDSYYYYYQTGLRSLYVGNTLFTSEDGYLSAYDLDSLLELGAIQLSDAEDYYWNY